MNLFAHEPDAEELAEHTDAIKAIVSAGYDVKILNERNKELSISDYTGALLSGDLDSIYRIGHNCFISFPFTDKNNALIDAITLTLIEQHDLQAGDLIVKICQEDHGMAYSTIDVYTMAIMDSEKLDLISNYNRDLEKRTKDILKDSCVLDNVQSSVACYKKHFFEIEVKADILKDNDIETALDTIHSTLELAMGDCFSSKRVKVTISNRQIKAKAKVQLSKIVK